MKKIIATTLFILNLNAVAQNVTQADKDLALNMPEKGWTILRQDFDSEIFIMSSSLKKDKNFYSVTTRSKFITKDTFQEASEHVKLFISIEDCKKQKGKILIRDLIENDNHSQNFDLSQKPSGDDIVFQNIVRLTCGVL